MKIVGMPQGGLHRAGRWHDVERYPPPAPAISAELGEPVPDGPRWEDAAGQFATTKLSRTAEAAIGRVFAKYQRANGAMTGPEPGERPPNPDVNEGPINRMLRWLSHEADYEHEPELLEGSVPVDIFARLCEIWVPFDPVLRFIDISSPQTLGEIDEAFGDTLESLGLSRVANLNVARQSDRRLSRIVITLLHLQYAREYAGIRVCGQPDPEWESYVVWSPPERIDLSAEDVRFRHVAAWDDDAKKAAERLGMTLPEN